jgi:hypothetical protein
LLFSNLRLGCHANASHTHQDLEQQVCVVRPSGGIYQLRHDVQGRQGGGVLGQSLLLLLQPGVQHRQRASKKVGLCHGGKQGLQRGKRPNWRSQKIGFTFCSDQAGW